MRDRFHDWPGVIGQEYGAAMGLLCYWTYFLYFITAEIMHYGENARKLGNQISRLTWRNRSGYGAMNV